MDFIILRMEERIVLLSTALLGVAVVTDLRTEKVPNQWIVAGYVIGAICRVRGLEDLLRMFIDILWPIILLYPLFLVRGLGAGDIKLFSVLSIFYSFSTMIQIMIISLYIGAGIIAVRFVYARLFQKSFQHYIHYTVCILAAYIVFLMKGGLI